MFPVCYGRAIGDFFDTPQRALRSCSLIVMVFVIFRMVCPVESDHGAVDAVAKTNVILVEHGSYAALLEDT